MYYKLIILLAFLSFSLSFNNLNYMSKNIKHDNMIKDIHDHMYLVVWINNSECKSLLENMRDNNLYTIFYDRNEYPIDELKMLYDLYVRKYNVDINDEKQPWIFSDDNYIGGIESIYNIINYYQ